MAEPVGATSPRDIGNNPTPVAPRRTRFIRDQEQPQGANAVHRGQTGDERAEFAAILALPKSTATYPRSDRPLSCEASAVRASSSHGRAEGVGAHRDLSGSAFASEPDPRTLRRGPPRMNQAAGSMRRLTQVQVGAIASRAIAPKGVS